MIAAFDVHYPAAGSALVAAVVFAGFSDAVPRRFYRKRIAHVAPYVPGEFYQRELPCILELLAEIEEPIDTIVIDGYVTLGDRPGLGAHLSASLGWRITIIGVAKSPFAGGRPAKAFRGRSGKPLYITACGIEQDEARRMVESMHGRFRMPTLLQEVDRLSREIST